MTTPARPALSAALLFSTILTPMALLATPGSVSAASINNTTPNTTGIVLGNGDDLTNSSTITDSTAPRTRRS